MRRASMLLLGIAASLSLAGPGYASLAVPWWTIDGGGTTSATGAHLRLCGTIGQPDAQSSSSGTLTLAGGFWMGGTIPSAVEEPEAPPPGIFLVSGGVPNPFRQSTTISIDLPETSTLDARIMDATGRLVRRLAMGTLGPGRHQITWNGDDEQGRKVASGVYRLRLQTEQVTVKRTVVLLR
jgi:hypothetical protein